LDKWNEIRQYELTIFIRFGIDPEDQKVIKEKNGMGNFRKQDLAIKKSDLISITIGLVGAVLLWIDIDPGGWMLYLAFLVYGSLRVSDFFSLNPYQRNRTQVVKFIFSLLMIITVITHVIWGGGPLFGLLATLVLVYSITNMESQERKLAKENQG